jgi:hypothetical protein
MPWVESHTVLLRHRKLIELAQDLRLKPVYTLGHLHALWHAALEQQEDGDLTSWSDELIADLSCYAGDAPQYVSLLQQHKWLDGKLIHDWLDYAGKYLTAKYRTANPRKLRLILEKHHKNYSRSKVGKKSTQPPIRLGRLSSSLKSESSEGGLGGVPRPAMVLPEWLDAEIWEQFEKLRQRLRKPLDEFSRNRFVFKKLTKFHDEGLDVNEMLEESILNSWQGVFPPKAGRSDGGKVSAIDDIRRRTAETLRRGL